MTDTLGKVANRWSQRGDRVRPKTSLVNVSLAKPVISRMDLLRRATACHAEASVLQRGQRFRYSEARRADHDAQSELGGEFISWYDPIEGESDEARSVQLEEEITAGDLIDRLGRATGSERRQLILEAETMQFEDSDRERLQRILRSYIEENRNSNARPELVAVAAAIRKFAASLDHTEMDWLGRILEPGHRAQPSLETELEAAKMVYRRYSEDPPIRGNPHPELSARLADIARAYLNPYIFPRGRFATVAMLAIQALLVMRSAEVDSIIQQVNELPFPWFREQLRRRMDKCIAQLPPDATTTIQLQALIAKIGVV